MTSSLKAAMVVGVGLCLTVSAWAFEPALSMQAFAEVRGCDGQVWRQSSADLEKKISGLSSQIARNPGDAQSLLEYAIALSDRGETAKALPIYQQALKLDPRNVDAYLNRGLDLEGLEKFYAARRDFVRVYQIDPTSAEAFLGLGRIAADRGLHQKSIWFYSKAIALDPKLADAYYERSGSYHELGKFMMAAEDLQKAIALNPNDACAYNALGIEQESMGLGRQALGSYDQAISLGPTLVDPLLNRGSLLLDLGRPDRAVEDFNRAIELNADDAEIYAARAEAYQVKGDNAQALADRKKALELDPAMKFSPELDKLAQS